MPKINGHSKGVGGHAYNQGVTSARGKFSRECPTCGAGPFRRCKMTRYPGTDAAYVVDRKTFHPDR